MKNCHQETTSWLEKMLQQHRDHSGGNFQIGLMTNSIDKSRDEPNNIIN